MNNNNNITNFNTQKNKEFLWKLMYENGIFKNLDNSLSGNIQMFFDNKMKSIDMKKIGSDTLISLNKRVITEMNNDIRSRNFMSVVKMQQESMPLQMQQGLVPLQGSVPMPLENMITSQEIFQNRQNVFDTQLKNMKNDFDSLINVSKPEVIDFSDNKSNKRNNNSLTSSALQPIPDENIDIEKLLAETISKRENLVITLNENEKMNASKWVNNNREVIQKATNPPQHKQEQQQYKQQQEQQQQQPYKTLKIGENIDFDLLEKGRKNVTFNEDLNNFIPHDETIENDDDDDDNNNIQKKIDDRLNKIDDKLNKIMDILLGIKNYQQEDKQEDKQEDRTINYTNYAEAPADAGAL